MKVGTGRDDGGDFGAAAGNVGDRVGDDAVGSDELEGIVAGWVAVIGGTGDQDDGRRGRDGRRPPQTTVKLLIPSIR
jgi:hypothetical protein